MTGFTEVVLARRRAQEKYFKNYLIWSRKIKKEAEQGLGPVKAFVFGSILSTDPKETPRDIDLLIVSSRLSGVDEKRKVKTKIWRKIGMDNPFEIHLATPQIYEDWYRRFIAQGNIEI